MKKLVAQINLIFVNMTMDIQSTLDFQHIFIFINLIIAIPTVKRTVLLYLVLQNCMSKQITSTYETAYVVQSPTVQDYPKQVLVNISNTLYIKQLYYPRIERKIQVLYGDTKKADIEVIF